MGKFVDLTGKRFGRLLVNFQDGYNKWGQIIGIVLVIVEITM